MVEVPISLFTKFPVYKCQMYFLSSSPHCPLQSQTHYWHEKKLSCSLIFFSLLPCYKEILTRSRLIIIKRKSILTFILSYRYSNAAKSLAPTLPIIQLNKLSISPPCPENGHQFLTGYLLSLQPIQAHMAQVMLLSHFSYLSNQTVVTDSVVFLNAICNI